MQTTTKHSKKMAMNPINKILVVILLIETFQVDPNMIEYKEESNPKPEEEATVQAPVKDIGKEVEVVDLAIENNFTNEEIDHIAKTVWGEARGLSETHQSAVVWTILNRIDDGRFGKGVIGVITAPSQFAGYRSGNPDYCTDCQLCYRYDLERRFLRR